MNTFTINVETGVGTHLFRVEGLSRAEADVALEVIIAGLRATDRADGRNVTVTEWTAPVGTPRQIIPVLPVDDRATARRS